MKNGRKIQKKNRQIHRKMGKQNVLKIEKKKYEKSTKTAKNCYNQRKEARIFFRFFFCYGFLLLLILGATKLSAASFTLSTELIPWPKKICILLQKSPKSWTYTLILVYFCHLYFLLLLFQVCCLRQPYEYFISLHVSAANKVGLLPG